MAAACSQDVRDTATVTATDPSGADGGTQGADSGAQGNDSGANGGASGGRNAGGNSFVGCNKMDVLFVIDNSGSMAEEQMNLAANFPKFIEVLNTFHESKLDYRVGVTTTSFPTKFLGITVGTGEEGALLKSASMTHPWLERTDPNVSETFTTIATVGVDGSGQEQPLKAAQAAVTTRVADQSNAGFLRPDALLAVIILTDEDDGSAGDPQMTGGLPIPLPGTDLPVTDFITTFDMVTGARERWAAAVIAGDKAPMCSSTFGNANYASRLLDFVKQTGSNAVFSSICDGDLSKSLEVALDTFADACDKFTLI